MKVYRLVLVLFFQILLAVVSCRESDKEMKISTGKVTNILNKSADVEGFIIDIGTGAVQYGHCYDKTPNVSAICLITQKGIPTGPGNYSSHLIDLEAGTKYYVRAYIDNGYEIIYGEEVSFTTLPPSAPAIITSSVNSITPTSAICGGSVVTDGGSPILARGVCWSATPNPTTSNSLTIDGVGSGDFVSNITGLIAGTTYYIRAYATRK